MSLPGGPASKRPASLSPDTLRTHSTPTTDDGMNDTPSAMVPHLSGRFQSPPSPTPMRGKAKRAHSDTEPTSRTDIGPTSTGPTLRKSSMRRTQTASSTSSTSRSVTFLVGAASEHDNVDEPSTRAPIEREEFSSPEPDDANDKDYGPTSARRPRSRVAQDLDPTTGMKFSPYKRRPSKSSVASSAKERVRQTDPNRANCLATNNPFPRACLQFAHILAQATSNIQLTLLEWWWQMAFWTLYIDTHFNIFVLRSDLHLSMDSDDWTLLPHHRVITQIYEWTTAVTEADPTGYNKNQRVPISKLYEGETDFTYFFLPLKDEMKKVAIHRFPTSEPAVDTTVDGDFDPLDFVTHSYPFTTIGPLTSHVHPHFVIFAAGQKLFKMAEAVSEREFKDILARLAKITSFGHDGDADSQDVISKNLTSLHDIVAIHARWTATTIEHEDFHVLRDEDFHVPQDEDFPEHEWLHHPAADLCVKHQCDHELQKQRKK